MSEQCFRRKRERLIDESRNGSSLVEHRQTGRDLVTEMGVASRRPDVLANQLRSMGVSQDGDEVLDD